MTIAESGRSESAGGTATVHVAARMHTNMASIRDAFIVWSVVIFIVALLLVTVG